MNILFFDTETTGFYNKSLGFTDKNQVKMVQLGAMLIEYKPGEVAQGVSLFDVLGELNVLVFPQRTVGGETYNFEVPEGASNVHGITAAKAILGGVSLQAALHMFKSLAKQADVIVAHNLAYDDQIMFVENGFIDFGWNIIRGMKRLCCTMEASTDVLKIPGRYGKFKWPKLQEAHKHFTGKEFEAAHDAMADVRACATVFHHLVKNGHIEL